MHPPRLPHCFGGSMHHDFLWHLITIETAPGLRIQCGALRAAHAETQGKEPGPWRRFLTVLDGEKVMELRTKF